MGLTLSLDVGTSGTKALLLNEDLRPIGSVASCDTPLRRDGSGRAEHDPGVVREVFFDVCRQAIGERGREISLVVVTSYQFGLLLADERGEPLTNISTFVDTRAQAHHAEFAAEVNLSEVYRRTGCPPIFQYPTTRLHLLKGTQNEVVRRTRYVWDSKAYLMFLLTGRSLTDYSTANSLGCLGLDGVWDEELIRSTGFEVAHFPEVVDGTRTRAQLLPHVCAELGLQGDTEVAVGLYDGAALAAALSGFEEGIAIGNFGTSGMFRLPMGAPGGEWDGGLIQSCPIRKGLFFNGAGINNATSASNWFLRAILKEPVTYLRDRDLSEPGARGVVCFPYLSGERDAVIGTLGVGSFLGVRETTTDHDMGRAVLEGVAFSFLAIKRKLDPANEISELRVGGGATANHLWMTILANILDIPVRTSGEPEMGILGAASLAVSAGDSVVMRARARGFIAESHLIEPTPALSSLYRELADRYLAMRENLLPIFRSYHGLLDP